MRGSFSFHNIEYRQAETGKGLIVRVEVINNSGRNFSAVVFRFVLFVRSIPISNFLVTVNGFYNGQARIIEKQAEELEYKDVVNQITNCEIFVEGAY